MSGDWTAAARHAVDGINARSNSLVPYALVAVESAEPSSEEAAAGGGATTRLVLSLQRGDRRERMAATVEDKGGGKFALRGFRPVG